jgi:signal transduction histidine kinase
MAVGSPRLLPGVEVAIAFLAGAATFAVVAVAVAAIESDVPVLLLAVPLVGAVVAVARRAGAAYAVPVAMASVLAYDWYYMPPTHAHEVPDRASLAELLVFLALAVLIGQIASRAGQRAEASDAARGELTDEQAALRRVATLVARGVPPPEVFAAVAHEIGQVLGVDVTHLGRYEPDDTVTDVASWSATGDHLPAGTRASLEGDSVSAQVLHTRRPARVNNYDNASGPIAVALRDLGVRSSVGAPIVVDGRIWGVAIASSKQREPLPGATESRIGAFSELVATAISNAQAGMELSRLAEDQAALRRVATLVAQGTGPDPVFGAVADEVHALLGADTSAVLRFDQDGMTTVMGAHRARRTPGTRFEPDPDYIVAGVRKTGRAARFDTDEPFALRMPEPVRAEGIRSGLASPIVVDGELWGAITVASLERSLPASTEQRLADFTDLVATAVANAHAREQVTVLADEQAALRRVATLVAQDAPSGDLFGAVAREVGALFGADFSGIIRYEEDASVATVATWAAEGEHPPVPARWETEPGDPPTIVAESRRAARVEDWESTPGPMAAFIRDVLGAGSSVGCPIVVEGRLWGALAVHCRQRRWLPPDTESRIAQFSDLVGTAIANADSRDQLTASRARLVTAGDEARRRVVRDLHDGAQQRLVHAIVTLKLARTALEDDDPDAESLVDEALEHVERGNAEVRELARGILPAVLTRGGLRAGVDSVVAPIDVPVDVDLPPQRFPAEIEASAYFILAEALTNVVKHAEASRATVRASVDDGMLRVEVRDDGVGGADRTGHGLVGMSDRVTALGGRLEIASPVGGGTLVAATLPL